MKEIFDRYNENALMQMQAIFASLFILANRIQTSFEKEQNELTMKQWLMLTMIEVCPKPHTLTNIGLHMGCSRQNAKQLAAALSKKGYVRLVPGAKNSLHIELTEKAAAYEKSVSKRNESVLRMLFSDFNESELQQLYDLYNKLYSGVEKMEKGRKT